MDSFVARRLEGISRGLARRLLEQGMVILPARPSDARIKPATRLDQGEPVVVTVPEPEPLEAIPQDIPLTVVYEDEHLVVVDKPAGLVVHPAPGHEDGTLVNALLHHCRDLSPIGGVLRPGIVHRIDRDTTGLLVVAKSALAHEKLAALFKAHDIQRRYRAVVHDHGRLPERGTFRTLFGRHPKDRKRFSSKVSKGREAVTHWQVERRLPGGLAEITVTLETGRTHQIRVHFSDHGCPLVGDRVYGGRRADRRLPPEVAGLAMAMQRQALHAELLGFLHPATGRPLTFQAGLPGDMARLLDGLGSLERVAEEVGISGPGRRFSPG